MINAQKAKELGVAVWSFLADNPDCHKCDLPYNLRKEIEGMKSTCPLCEYFNDDRKGYINCNDCPVDDCYDADSNWDMWYKHADDEDEDELNIRREAAENIRDLIIAWEI